MFDRGVISVDDDYSILVADGRVPAPVTNLINPDRRLRLPPANAMRPHPQFLKHHREEVFKG